MTHSAVAITSHRAFLPAYLGLSLLLGAVLVLVDHPLANLTDEDDYMPLGLGDLLRGENPYSVGRAGATHEIDPTCTWHDEPRCWYSLPYLPLSLVLQIPFLDYRWTALVAFGLLAWAVRDRPWAFVTLASPPALLLAANGFTDLVVLALLAWSLRLSWRPLAWLACGAKQFALPLVLLHHGLRREWSPALQATAATAIVVVPFVLWDPAAFVHWAVQVHIMGGDHKWWGLLGVGHGNYLLYYAFAATILFPDVRRHATRPERAAGTAAAPEA